MSKRLRQIERELVRPTADPELAKLYLHIYLHMRQLARGEPMSRGLVHTACTNAPRK
jgi:hypothetical protein